MRLGKAAWPPSQKKQHGPPPKKRGKGAKYEKALYLLVYFHSWSLTETVLRKVFILHIKLRLDYILLPSTNFSTQDFLNNFPQRSHKLQRILFIFLVIINRHNKQQIRPQRKELYSENNIWFDCYSSARHVLYYSVTYCCVCGEKQSVAVLPWQQRYHNLLWTT